MNREQKRMMQRQGQVNADGTVTRRASAQDVRRRRPRTSPSEFFQEVREELRQVAWPKREETKNYTQIVLGVLVFMTGLIYVLSYEFSRFVTFLFQK